jgi:hypothetical protein
MGFWGGLAGGAAGFMVGGPAGAAAGYGLGSKIGDEIGGGISDLKPSAEAERLYGGVNRDNFNLPGYQQQYNKYGALAGQYGNRAAPTAGYSQFRGDQRAFGGQLAAEARGQGIGQQIVRQQAQQAANRAGQQQFAQAAGGPSSMAALSQRNAAMNAANAQSAVGGQAALAGGQMQLGAMGQYGSFLSDARGADESMGQFNARQRQQQMQLNQEGQLQALRDRLNASQMQQQGGMGYESARTARYGALMGKPTDTAVMAGGLADLAKFGATAGWFGEGAQTAVNGKK